VSLNGDLSLEPTQAVARRLARGSGVYAATNLGLKALGFVLLGVYVRFLSPSDYGIVGLAEAVGLLVGIVTGLGLEGGIRRLYFQLADEPDTLQAYVSTILRFSAASSAALVAATTLLGPMAVSWIAPGFGIAFFPYLWLAIVTAAATHVLQCRLMIYQCEERLLAYAAFAAVQAASTAVLTLGLVVWAQRGAAGLLAGRALGVGAVLALAFALSGSLWRGRWRWSFVRATLRVSLPLVPHGLMAIGLLAADRFILQRYRPMSEVGLYSVAYSIGMVMPMVTAAVARAWTPLFFSIQRDGAAGKAVAARIFADLVLILAASAAVGALLAQDFVRWFVDDRYAPAGRVAPILLGAYLCHSLFMLFQLSAVQAQRTALVVLVSAVALAANLALNFALVPVHGMYGAAYAALVAYAIEMALMAVIAQRLLPMPYGWFRPSAALAGFAVLLAWTQLTSSTGPWFVLAGAVIAAGTVLAILRGPNVRRGYARHDAGT
jgi:O-antigen/teichoic acid export membrane protein